MTLSQPEEATKTAASLDQNASPSQSDRRLYRRYLVAVPALLLVDGETHDCAITDLSLGGTAISPAIKCPKGTACTLLCDEFYYEPGIAGEIVNSNDTATHIKFDLNEDMEAALTMYLVMSPATR